MSRIVKTVVAAAALTVVAGIIGPPVLAQTTTAVDVQDNDFVAPDITITVGDTVEWTQSGSNPHTVTADDGSFDSHPNCFPDCMGSGDTFTRTFDTAGDVAYFCKIHGGAGGQGMAGVVRVRAAQPDPTTATPPTTAAATPTTGAAGPTSTAAVAETTDQLPRTGFGAPVLVAAALGLLTVGLVARRAAGRRAPLRF